MMGSPVEDSAARRACKPCARAKVRCTWARADDQASVISRTGSLVCDRCMRLKKLCSQQESSARAAPLPRTRFGQLERKVEALFQTLNQSQDISRSRLPSESSPASSVSKPTVSSSEPPKEEYHAPPNLLTPPYSLVAVTTPVTDESLWPSDDQADALLALYANKMGGGFPFVVPPCSPAREVRQTRPFLFKAMLTAASYRNREMQKRRAKDFITSLTSTIFLEGSKPFDALQGLLVHVAWYQCYLSCNTQMTNLVQLAISIMADLELNKPVHANDRRKLIYDNSRSSYGFTSETRVLTNDERRALLGCYYLSSTASIVNRKVDAIVFSSYMEDALEKLVASQDKKGDILLCYLVRLQRIVHDITRAIPFDEPQRPQSRGAPFVMHVKLLDKSLSEFQETLPVALQDNHFLSMHLCTVRIFLYEVGLYDAPWEGASSHQRLDGMWSCVEGISAFIKTFCSLPVESYITMPYVLWGHLSHALLTASRVCLIKFDGWDSRLLDDGTKFPAALDAVTERLILCHQFAKAHWLGDQDDLILARVTKKFEWIRSWFEEHTGEKHPRSIGVIESENGNGNADAAAAAERGAKVAVGGTQDVRSEMFMDSRFWEEIMAEYQAMPEAFMANPDLDPGMYPQ